ncbi:MAG: hypothetical protein K2N63_09590, partial [Lachnospiraceae bacterium]|nr:hypothetical protein [Lachnospiraceae bacterium]
ALTLLSSLYSEAPKNRSVVVLANLAGIARSEAEDILQKFTELNLTEELELETEDGSAKAYTVNLNGAAVPLLTSARLALGQSSPIKIIADKREYGKGRN